VIVTAAERRTRIAIRQAAPGLGLTLDDRQVNGLAKATARAAGVERPAVDGRSDHRPPPTATPAMDRPSVRPEDVDLLRLVAYGLDNAQIAEQLGWTVNAVKARLARLFQLLGVDGRVQATAAGYELGLLGAAR